MKVTILEILAGRKGPFRGPDELSAITKSPVTGPVTVGRLGLDGDEQADLSVHGGPDKAIHHYPFDHYGWWRNEIGDHALLGEPGGFGENISTKTMTEEKVCIGDRYRMGSAIVEISQGRQPCWKLDHRFGGLRINAKVVGSRRTGWYYRVIEEGRIDVGDTIELLDRPYSDWDVRRVFGLLVAGDAKRDPGSLRGLQEVRALSEAWKSRLAALLGK